MTETDSERKPVMEKVKNCNEAKHDNSLTKLITAVLAVNAVNLTLQLVLLAMQLIYRIGT